MYFSDFKLEIYFVPHTLGQPRLVNPLSIRPPLSIPSYPIRQYDEDFDERMTAHRDAPMERNEDVNEKD